MIDRNTLLFFDASCLIAASGSPSGGSSLLLSLCAQGLFRAAVSQPVLLEAERNIAGKLGPEALSAYHRLVALTPMAVVPVPLEPERRAYRAMVGEKDEHVAAAAVYANADFLLTLDKRLADRVNEAGLEVRALSPGEFIKSVLPDHADYPAP
jgi:predicted nucleic acid-binding protein